jgi:hypothetical protein
LFNGIIFTAFVGIIACGILLRTNDFDANVLSLVVIDTFEAIEGMMPL